MVDSLAKIFGNLERVKVMRLFLFNPGEAFLPEEVSNRLNISLSSAKKEMELLVSAKFIRRRVVFKEVSKKFGKNKVLVKRRVNALSLDPNFSHLESLKSLLMDTRPIQNGQLLKKLSRAGKIKLIVLSGFFLQDPDARVDILIVGDRLNKFSIDRTIKGMEEEFGRELRYSVFETQDFNYRVSIYDKLVRDIFDYPHKRILDRIFIS